MDPLVPTPAPPSDLLVPRVRFKEKRSVKAADPQERDEQAKAIGNVVDEAMDDEIDSNYENSYTDPISPAGCRILTTETCQ